MTYLLDTNVFVDLTTYRKSNGLDKLVGFGPTQLATSSISLAELQYGETKSQIRSKSLAAFRELLHMIRILSFDEQAAKIYGDVRADLERRGGLIGGNDLLIASTALAHDLILVTRDVSDFRRVEGLKIEDWST